jgi:hypothetical protein
MQRGSLAETRAGVRDVSLSLAPYRRFVRPLKTNSGRAASSLKCRKSSLRTTQERGRGGTRASVGCAWHHSALRVRARGAGMGAVQPEVPADHTRERARGHTRVSGDAPGIIAPCACAHEAQVWDLSSMQRGQRRVLPCVTCLSPSLLTQGS